MIGYRAETLDSGRIAVVNPEGVKIRVFPASERGRAEGYAALRSGQRFNGIDTHREFLRDLAWRAVERGDRAFFVEVTEELAHLEPVGY